MPSTRFWKKAARLLFVVTVVYVLFAITIGSHYINTTWPFGGRVKIERLTIEHDEDGDGVYDLEDIVDGAREEVRNKPRYKSAYYAGGYPPDNEGVCTDVIWRALKHAGYNLKEMVDEDIRKNTELYPRVLADGRPDPNIDFRRVDNLRVFFSRFALELTTKVMPGDEENLKEWQGGDIVIFAKPAGHIGIISDKRRRDGVPYLIHNGGPYPKENNVLLRWGSEITGHYRYPKIDDN